MTMRTELWWYQLPAVQEAAGELRAAGFDDQAEALDRLHLDAVRLCYLVMESRGTVKIQTQEIDRLKRQVERLHQTVGLSAGFTLLVMAIVAWVAFL